MKAGTFPWLIQHELRLWWRDVSTNAFNKPLLIFVGLAIAILLVWLWFGLSSFREVLVSTTLPDWATWIAVGLWVISFLYAFYQAMERSVIALFDRGDLDLLVSSPVSSKAIFASRLLGVAIEVFLSFSLIVVPFSLIAVSIGIPRLLGIYPALIGLSLTAASLAMLLTLWLVRLLGARRARTFAQVLTAVMSALLFLAFQLPNMLQGKNLNAEGLLVPLRFLFAEGGLLSANSLVWFPARAIFFDPLSVVLTLLISSALAWLTVETLYGTFITGTQQSVTHKRKQLRSTQETRFTGGFNRIILFKEWRMIWRNPYLLSRTFLQILFLLPLFVVVMGDNRGKAIASFTTFLSLVSVAVGSQLAMTLTKICVSAEEAPDLLKSSPANGKDIRRLKLLAALIPSWLLLSPLFVILMVRGEPWLVTLVMFLGATTCSAILQLWNSCPIPTASLFSRRREDNKGVDTFLGFLESISIFAWTCLAFGTGMNNVWLIGISLAAIVLTFAIAYRRSREIGTSLGF